MQSVARGSAHRGGHWLCLGSAPHSPTWGLLPATQRAPPPGSPPGSLPASEMEEDVNELMKEQSQNVSYHAGSLKKFSDYSLIHGLSTFQFMEKN